MYDEALRGMVRIGMNNKYKTIRLDLKRELCREEIKCIEGINADFSKEDIYLNSTNNEIITNIHAVDLMSLKNYVRTMSNRYALESNSNPFFEIIREIEDIRSYGIKGKKRIYVDYNKERKVKNREQKSAKRESYFYANEHSFNTENNILPEDYENKIICGDSEDILKKLPDNCIDLMFTSPPYNFGLDYHKGEDDLHWKEYFNKLFRIFNECIRVLKYGGRFVVNVQPLFSDYIPSHHIISNYCMEKKLIWKGEVLWEKNNYNCKYTAWGSWKSPSSPYLKYTWEFIEIFCKGTMKKNGKTNDIDITAEEFKKWVVAKWSVAPERNMKTYGHPAMFPTGLVERVVKLFSFKNDVILDPFNGLGSTTLVARRFNRKYLGIDNSETYCKKAEKRMNEELL